ncbi:MAG: SDR family NAD(P)-dependent oxidoreductase [Ilumatobacteraceae bacterium]
MENAFGDPQTIVLLGGTSEIGRAIVDALVTPAAGCVVLAQRDPATAGSAEYAESLRARGVDRVEVRAFDARSHDEHQGWMRELAAEIGDLDLVVLAFGVLGDQATFDADPAAAAVAVDTNFTGSVSAGLATAEVLRRQGHGRLVVLSSVAGERVRKANFVYGASKAGQDAFAQGLADSLVGSGASVLVVRPGFVRSKMTDGMDDAPFSTTPQVVAARTVAGLRSGATTVWAPGILRWVFAVMRHLPRSVWRRMPR